MRLETEKDNPNHSCDNCIWGDKCREVDKMLNKLGDTPCDDFFFIDEYDCIDCIIEENRNEYMGEWQEYQEEWGLIDND